MASRPRRENPKPPCPAAGRAHRIERAETGGRDIFADTTAPISTAYVAQPGGTPMPKLASHLPSAEQVAGSARRVRKGPTGACDIYGTGDLDDWAAVERLRLATCWADAQKAVDETLGIERPIDDDKFRYHWRRRCWHWTPEQRRADLEVAS